jgi:hypothetical protein
VLSTVLCSKVGSRIGSKVARGAEHCSEAKRFRVKHQQLSLLALLVQRYSVYLLYSYKSTNTDAEGGEAKRNAFRVKHQRSSTYADVC